VLVTVDDVNRAWVNVGMQEVRPDSDAVIEAVQFAVTNDSRRWLGLCRAWHCLTIQHQFTLQRLYRSKLQLQNLTINKINQALLKAKYFSQVATASCI